MLYRSNPAERGLSKSGLGKADDYLELDALNVPEISSCNPVPMRLLCDIDAVPELIHRAVSNPTEMEPVGLSFTFTSSLIFSLDVPVLRYLYVLEIPGRFKLFRLLRAEDE